MSELTVVCPTKNKFPVKDESMYVNISILQHEATRVDTAGTLKLRFCILFLFIDFLLRIFYIFLFTSSARFH